VNYFFISDENKTTQRKPNSGKRINGEGKGVAAPTRLERAAPGTGGEAGWAEKESRGHEASQGEKQEGRVLTSSGKRKIITVDSE